jgi:hypothetical protein
LFSRISNGRRIIISSPKLARAPELLTLSAFRFPHTRSNSVAVAASERAESEALRALSPHSFIVDLTINGSESAAPSPQFGLEYQPELSFIFRRYDYTACLYTYDDDDVIIIITGV